MYEGPCKLWKGGPVFKKRSSLKSHKVFQHRAGIPPRVFQDKPTGASGTLIPKSESKSHQQFAIFAHLAKRIAP